MRWATNMRTLKLAEITTGLGPVSTPSVHAPASNRLRDPILVASELRIPRWSQTPRLIYWHRRRTHVSKHKNCMAPLCLHSEHRHEPDQSGHPHAAFADVGRRDRQHHRDRAPARPYPTRDYPAATAA